MRLTRQELVEIVKEEMAHPRGDLGKNIADVDFPVLVGYEGRSEIAYNQDELDNILDTVADQGIAYSLDSLADVEVQDLPAGVEIEVMEKVTITKSRLSEMIRRTVQSTINEQVVGYQAPEGAEESEQDDYLTTGQTSIAAKPHSQEEEQAADTSTRELTQQRQQQLDKDDAVTADDTGRQLQDLLNQKNEGKMIVTRKQLIRIIEEALMNESIPGESMEEKFGAKAPHPLLRDSMVGNGYVTSIYTGPPIDLARKNAGTNEHMKVLVDIYDGKIKLNYVPFVFADQVMMEFSKLGLDPKSTDRLDMDMMGDDNEYTPPGW